MTSPRILVDAASLLLRSAGVKNYTYHWLRALEEQAPGMFDAYPFLGSSLGTLNHDGSNFSLAATVPRIVALQFFNKVMPGALSPFIRKYSLFHVSNQVKHPPASVPVSATIHDMTCWLLPETHTAANRAADEAFADRVIRRARGLIAVSEHTRQDAIRILKLDPAKIRTIYSGVPQAYFDAAPTVRAKPYLLYAGTIEPRKNVDLLLDAFARLDTDHELLIAGPEGWNSTLTMQRLRQNAVRNVRYLGYVPEADMPGLFAGATAFVYPSLYEGFGFPVAQAMAARVPVVTSNASCLPEVAGDGALTVDPRSEAELTSALQRVIEDSRLRDTLANAGRQRADLYRWETCARQSIAWFRELT
ncbi:glycosyl transferase family 1 [Bryobacterales bacterium F-183]|nr:glycosyl transferase family 1 [Bryobacterales bacterium F-183]